MKRFDHDKLCVYQAAIDFVAFTEDVVKSLPRGRAYLSDQLQRASTSVPLNVAEGAGEFSSNEKARFYRISRRSAPECAAILDVLWRLRLLDEGSYELGRDHLVQIVSMLIPMIRRHSESGKGKGKGKGKDA